MRERDDSNACEDTAPLQIWSHRRAHWFWCDNELIDCHAQALGPIGVALYVALARYAHHKTGQCWPSLVRLSAQLGMTHLTARRYLHRLVERGLIAMEPRPGHTTLITLLDMPEVRVPSQDGKGSLPRNEVNEEGSYEITTPRYDVTTPLLSRNTEPDSLNQKERTNEPPENVCDMKTETPPIAPTISSLSTLPERPDDVLNHLDAATVASLAIEAQDVMVARVPNPFLRTKPLLHSLMVELWCQQQVLLHEGVAVGAGVQDHEEGRASAATRAA
jgi:hypothetical protein